MTESNNIVRLRSPARLAAEMARAHPGDLPEVWDRAWGRLLKADGEFRDAMSHRPNLLRDGATGLPAWLRLDVTSLGRGHGNPFIAVNPAETAAAAERLWRVWPDLPAAWEEFERIDRAAIALIGRGT